MFLKIQKGLIRYKNYVYDSSKSFLFENNTIEKVKIPEIL